MWVALFVYLKFGGCLMVLDYREAMFNINAEVVIGYWYLFFDVYCVAAVDRDSALFSW
jgi:hypothetical protein